MGCLAAFAIIAAIIWILATQYAIVFWLVVIPLAVILIMAFIGWLKK